MDDLVDRLRRAKNMTLRVGALCRMADEAADRIEVLEARLAAADKLAEACDGAFDGIDATGTQEFYLALAAYQATKD